MGKPIGEIPRGVEVLVKKAAVDPAFREALLRERGAAAGRIGLALEPAEQAMLAAIPARQLEQVIAGTRVPAPLRAAFMGYAAAAMLAALWANRGYCEDIATEGSEVRNDGPPANEILLPTEDLWKSQENLDGDADYATVDAEVIDANGQPIAGALVVVRGLNRYAKTDASGRCKIDRIPPGNLEVKASRISYGEQVIKVDIGPNCVIPLVFALSSCSNNTNIKTGIRPDDVPTRDNPPAPENPMDLILGK